MCNAPHSRRDGTRSAAIARNCAECVRGRGMGDDFDDDPLGAVRRLTRGAGTPQRCETEPAGGPEDIS
jgi:hypothetical protein